MNECEISALLSRSNSTRFLAPRPATGSGNLEQQLSDPRGGRRSDSVTIREHMSTQGDAYVFGLLELR